MRELTQYECDLSLDEILTSEEPKIIRHNISRMLDSYPDFVFGFGRGKIYWRARKCPDGGFPTEDELWHPPASITPHGRLNDAGDPRLYLSSTIETALCEVGASTGDFVHVAGFRVLPDQILHVASIGELSHVQKTGYLRSTGVDPDRTIARTLNGYPRAQALQILYVDSALALLLANTSFRSRDYLPTRILAQLTHKRASRIDGIFYPSVQAELGLNLSVRSASAKRVFHQVASAVLKVNRAHRFGYFDIETIRIAQGIGEQNEYQWQQTIENDSIVVFNLTREEFEKGQGSRKSLLDLPAQVSIPPDNAGRLRRWLRRLVD